MSKLKIRCSALGQIIGKPKSKSETLTQTAKTYVQDLAKQHIYGFRRSVESKYMSKGTQEEENAINLLSYHLDEPLLSKNEVRKENDFITGECDIETPDSIRDIKCSWDAKSFPLFDTKIPNKDYYWQLQGYMWLYGKSKAFLDYCLVNTPEELQYNESDCFDYDNVLIKHRIKTFDIERSEEDIELIKSKVEACRVYYNELITY